MDKLRLFDIATSNDGWITNGIDVQWKIDGDVLVFQCTKSRSDWAYNFMGWVQAYKDTPIPWFAHAGFVRLWKSVQDKVVSASKALKVKYVTGFSQGAALATLAAEDLAWRGMEIDCAVFGSPRVVWMPSDSIHRRFDLMENIHVHGDIVTWVPPAVLGYRHVGKVSHIGRIYFPGPWQHQPSVYQAALEGL